MKKIAIIAPYPADSVLPDKLLKSRVLQTSKLKHPAPWVRALCRELSVKSGIELEVFSHSRDVTQIHRAEKEGIKYTFIPKYESMRFDPFHFYLPAFLQFRPLIKKFNPNVVHGFGMERENGMLAVNQKKPSVVFIQGILEKYASYSKMSTLRLNIRKKLEQMVVWKADGLVAETEFARHWAKSVCPEKKVKIIPHACTKTFFDGRPEFKQKRLICIGALSRRKGCTTVIEAFASGVKRNSKLFKQAELVYIGTGSLADELKSRAKNHRINEYICFHGKVAHEEIIHEMEKACCLVIGSRMDTSPNVITEAHAVGIPVIGTTAGGIPEMIEEERDGFVVPVDDIEALSRRMELLLSDMELCAEMGRAGREKVRILNDPSRVADAHIAFYEEILAESRR
jgi:glycosyltransferase involved in cell wall biosynthesis